MLVYPLSSSTALLSLIISQVPADMVNSVKVGVFPFNDTTCKVRRKAVLCLTIPLARKEGYVMFNDTTC